MAVPGLRPTRWRRTDARRRHPQLGLRRGRGPCDAGLPARSAGSRRASPALHHRTGHLPGLALRQRAQPRGHHRARRAGPGLELRVLLRHRRAEAGRDARRGEHPRTHDHRRRPPRRRAVRRPAKPAAGVRRAPALQRLAGGTRGHAVVRPVAPDAVGGRLDRACARRPPPAQDRRPGPDAAQRERGLGRPRPQLPGVRRGAVRARRWRRAHAWTPARSGPSPTTPPRGPSTTSNGRSWAGRPWSARCTGSETRGV